MLSLFWKLRITILKIECSLYFEITDWTISILNIENYLDCDSPFLQSAKSSCANKLLKSGIIFMFKITLLKTEYTLYIENADLKISIVNIGKYLDFEFPLS